MCILARGRMTPKHAGPQWMRPVIMVEHPKDTLNP